MGVTPPLEMRTSERVSENTFERTRVGGIYLRHRSAANRLVKHQGERGPHVPLATYVLPRTALTSRCGLGGKRRHPPPSPRFPRSLQKARK